MVDQFGIWVGLLALKRSSRSHTGTADEERQLALVFPHQAGAPALGGPLSYAARVTRARTHITQTTATAC